MPEPGELLGERFAEVARTHAERPALRSGGETLSYAELHARVETTGGWLAARGVRPGERVAILAENRFEVIIAFWAALAIGAVAVVLNRRLEPRELAEVVADCEPALILTTASLAEGPVGHLGPPVVCFDRPEDGFAEPGPAAEPWRAEPTSPAVIVYTSGSSGRSKGVCLSHRNLWTVVRTVIAQTRLSPEDSYLLLVPLHYVHGILQLLSHHLAGAAIHLSGEFFFPGKLVEQLAAEKITGFSGVPLHFVQLVDRGGFLPAELPQLRWLTVTGGKCPPERLLRILEAKPGVEIFIAYGQTECAPRATLLDPARVARKPESVGAPIPGVEVVILGSAGEKLGPGEVGEVVVAGENVMLGYWRNPEASLEAVDEQGRLHTGDLGYFDAEGDLFLTGRRSSMIKTGGERIFAEKVEKVLRGHSGVADVVVLGIPDEVLGERIEAHVVPLEPPVDVGAAEGLRKSLHRHALDNLPFAHAPKAYHLWLELPHKEHGKIDRQALQSGRGGRRWGERREETRDG